MVGTLGTSVDGFSFIPLKYLNEEDLIAGSMPRYKNEIVIDEWLAEKIMKEENIISHSIINPQALIGKSITSARVAQRMVITGISRTRNLCAYMNDAGIFSISDFGSGVFISEDHLKDVFIENIVKSEVCEIITEDKQALYDFLNAFETEDEYKDLSRVIKISARDYFSEKADPYYKDRDSKLKARSVVIAMIILVCLSTLFIAMKSHANESMIYTTVYRLLGIRKLHVVRMYAEELALTAISVSLPATFITVGIFKFVEALPGFEFRFIFTWQAYILTNLAIVVIAVFVGVLPCILMLRKTPAQLVTDYDL